MRCCASLPSVRRYGRHVRGRAARTELPVLVELRATSLYAHSRRCAVGWRHPPQRGLPSGKVLWEDGAAHQGQRAEYGG